MLGAQANVWTEVMEDRARVDYQAFPRLAAFAEVAWSRLPAPAERDFAGFERRMAAHYARLDALGSATGRPRVRGRGSGGPACSDARSRGRPRTCDRRPANPGPKARARRPWSTREKRRKGKGHRRVSIRAYR